MRDLVIKLTVGADAVERASQGLTVAALAVTAGAAVSLWLAGEASRLGCPGGAAALELAHATPAADLLAVVLQGGTVTVCTACAARRGLTAADLLDGVRIAGAASFVEESLRDGVQALVY